MSQTPADTGSLADFPRLQNVNASIDRVELFRFDVNKERRFSFGVWHNRQHVFLRLWAGGHCGWGEQIGSTNNPKLDVAERGACFHQLLGMSVSEALRHVYMGCEDWPPVHRESAEMALVDLAGRLTDTPAIELLGLEAGAAVPGLFCILSDDPETVRSEAQIALRHNLRTHLKVKLYGKTEVDLRVLAAARQVMGPQAYIVGDANDGYRPHASDEPVEDIASKLILLHRGGLSACEDPGALSTPQWIELQQRVGALDLLPDEPMRWVWKSLTTVTAGMGRVYNIHPDCCGSILGAVRLGRKIQAFPAHLMIGDDSLIGPACTAWQQLAIGLRADWVEALEKPEESDAFLQCVCRQATAQQADGRYVITRRLPGFGLQVDDASLARHTAAAVSFR